MRRRFWPAILLAVSSQLIGAPLRVVFESPLTKVFLDEQPPPGIATWSVQMARGERESFQLLITADNHSLKDVSVDNVFSGPSGLSAELSLVGYVRTLPENRRPWAKTEGVGKIGWLPDPLLPNRQFDVAAGETQPVWVTVFAVPGTPAGEYRAKLRVRIGSKRVRTLPYHVRIHDVELPVEQQLRNAAFMSPQTLYAHYHPSGGIDGDEFFALYKRWVRKAFTQHLGPAFDMLMGWTQSGKAAPTEELSGRAAHLSWPVRWKDGYDFGRVEELAEIGREYGMQQFAIAIFDRREAWEQHTETMKADLADYLRSYAAYLRSKGMLDQAYVYNADEPPEKLWDTVRKNYRFVKEAVPELRVWLCLNEPKGVKALQGYTDIWDVYIRQYEKTGIRALQRTGEQVIWAVCVWPHEHPNLFIEYPAVDARMIGWLTYRYEISGFEYWSLNFWGGNLGQQQWAKWQKGDTRTNWQPTRWPWGDGWLMYPGERGEPLSSIRFENLRDGFEDAELLLTLASEGHKPESERIAALVAPSIDRYVSGFEQISKARESLLAALASLESRSAARNKRSH